MPFLQEVIFTTLPETLFLLDPTKTDTIHRGTRSTVVSWPAAD